MEVFCAPKQTVKSWGEGGGERDWNWQSHGELGSSQKQSNCRWLNYIWNNNSIQAVNLVGTFTTIDTTSSHFNEVNIDKIQALAVWFVLPSTIVASWLWLGGPNIGQTNGLHTLYKKQINQKKSQFIPISVSQQTTKRLHVKRLSLKIIFNIAWFSGLFWYKKCLLATETSIISGYYTSST